MHQPRFISEGIDAKFELSCIRYCLPTLRSFIKSLNGIGVFEGRVKRVTYWPAACGQTHWQQREIRYFRPVRLSLPRNADIGIFIYSINVQSIGHQMTKVMPVMKLNV